MPARIFLKVAGSAGPFSQERRVRDATQGAHPQDPSSAGRPWLPQGGVMLSWWLLLILDVTGSLPGQPPGPERITSLRMVRATVLHGSPAS